MNEILLLDIVIQPSYNIEQITHFNRWKDTQYS